MQAGPIAQPNHSEESADLVQQLNKSDLVAQPDRMALLDQMAQLIWNRLS